MVDLPKRHKTTWSATFRRALGEGRSAREAARDAWQAVLDGVLGSDAPTLAEAPKIGGRVVTLSEQGDRVRFDDAVKALMADPAFSKRYADESERRTEAVAIARANLEMTERFSSLVSLAEPDFISLDDGKVGQWLHSMSIGTFKHPVYGELSFPPERITRFAEGVNNRVRGVDLVVDYDHRQSSEGNKAAGWIVAAETRVDGLWTLVEWTKPAADAIRNREWRYFSPEFADEWMDAGGVVHKDVLLGGGLTNRPFLKNLVPVNLNESDIFDDPEEGVDMKWLNDLLVGFAKTLGIELDEKIVSVALAEGASDEQQKALSAAVLDAAKSYRQQQEQAIEEARAEGASSDDVAAKAFAEAYPEQAEEMKRLREENDDRAATLFLSEHTLDAKHPIPPAVNEDDRLKKFFVGLSSEQRTTFGDILAAITATGTVDLSEQGHAGGDGEGEGSDSDRFLAEVQKVQDEAKKAGQAVTFREAVTQVTQKHPDLANDYYRSTRKEA